VSWNIADVRELEDAILKLKLTIVQKIGVRAGMTVVDMGCGQGGFTVALAKTVGAQGKVLAVDVSNEYLAEFTDRLSKHGVKNIVTFLQADAGDLKGVLPYGVAEVVASYRFLEELVLPEAAGVVVREMVRVAGRGGRVCFAEMCIEPQNEAEETYIRLHRESGDSLFEPVEIVGVMKKAKLVDIRVEEVGTSIWLSPELSKQELGHAQVWYDAGVERSLGGLIDEYGMKYPAFFVFCGTKK
jgi:ubiquinone/menaquinone biosynthesis C-methylase UbiE